MDGVSSLSLVSLQGEKGLVSRQRTWRPQGGNKGRQSCCFKSEVSGMRKVGKENMEFVTNEFGPYLKGVLENGHGTQDPHVVPWGNWS